MNHKTYMLLHRIIGNVMGLMAGLDGPKKDVANMVIDRLYVLEQMIKDLECVQPGHESKGSVNSDNG